MRIIIKRAMHKYVNKCTARNHNFSYNDAIPDSIRPTNFRKEHCLNQSSSVSRYRKQEPTGMRDFEQ